jgi:hypothetical protein
VDGRFMSGRGAAALTLACTATQPLSAMATASLNRCKPKNAWAARAAQSRAYGDGAHRPFTRGEGWRVRRRAQRTLAGLCLRPWSAQVLPRNVAVLCSRSVGWFGQARACRARSWAAAQSSRHERCAPLCSFLCTCKKRAAGAAQLRGRSAQRSSKPARFASARAGSFAALLRPTSALSSLVWTQHRSLSTAS